MATLTKLTLKGVRAFSDSKPAEIEFKGRITLILGANGTGKTTILECLRFAITGCMPPFSRSGKSFVNDPTLRGRTKTTASIDLHMVFLENKLPGFIRR